MQIINYSTNEIVKGIVSDTDRAEMDAMPCGVAVIRRVSGTDVWRMVDESEYDAEYGDITAYIVGK